MKNSENQEADETDMGNDDGKIECVDRRYWMLLLQKIIAVVTEMELDEKCRR